MSTKPTRTLETFPNPNPERDYLIPRRGSDEFHLPVPVVTGSPTSPPPAGGVRARPAVRRAQVVEALPLVLPQRGGVSRGGHQPHPRRPGGRRAPPAGEGGGGFSSSRGDSHHCHRGVWGVRGSQSTVDSRQSGVDRMAELTVRRSPAGTRPRGCRLGSC